jgi:hypothetical protein
MFAHGNGSLSSEAMKAPTAAAGGAAVAAPQAAAPVVVAAGVGGDAALMGSGALPGAGLHEQVGMGLGRAPGGTSGGPLPAPPVEAQLRGSGCDSARHAAAATPEVGSPSGRLGQKNAQGLLVGSYGPQGTVGGCVGQGVGGGVGTSAFKPLAGAGL